MWLRMKCMQIYPNRVIGPLEYELQLVGQYSNAYEQL
jgi:hypothetical protein